MSLISSSEKLHHNSPLNPFPSTACVYRSHRRPAAKQLPDRTHPHARTAFRHAGRSRAARSWEQLR